MAKQGDHLGFPDVTDVPTNKLFDMAGRTTVVTGAGRGLGRAIAWRFVDAGATTYLTDVNMETAEASAKTFNASGAAGKAVAVKVDVRDGEQMHALAEQAAKETGRLDAWVNNAGIFPPGGDPLKTNADYYARMLDVNVIGVQHGIAAAAEQMIKLKSGGAIVNIASASAYRGCSAYSASKWAVRGITQGYARHLGRYGIRSVGVGPTVIDTEGVQEIMGATAGVDSTIEKLIGTLPATRREVPDDIARVALFLASDAAAYITGVTLPVDGGSLVPTM